MAKRKAAVAGALVICGTAVEPTQTRRLPATVAVSWATVRNLANPVES